MRRLDVPPLSREGELLWVFPCDEADPEIGVHLGTPARSRPGRV
jgi:hypothetical protein